MNQITEGNKTRLKEKIIQGAQNYKAYLLDKCFKIVCEDGTQEVIRFFKGDFKHLTGVESDLDDDAFFENCMNGTISTGNIPTEQKYNWSTLRAKSNGIENVQELLYEGADKSLLLEALKTHTCTFPVAVRNDNVNICIGFASNIHKARSLRKASSSHDAKKEKKIIAIFGKKSGDKTYGELVYIKDKNTLLAVASNIKAELSVDLQSFLNNK